MKSFLCVACFSFVLVSVACYEKGQNIEIGETGTISNIIKKLQQIHETALQHKEEENSKDNKTQRLIDSIIANDVAHPSELSCLATALYDLRAARSYGESDKDIDSEYLRVLDDAFWCCVYTLSDSTDETAMYEMERLCRYLDGLGVYDAGNALMMNHAIESQQLAASKERGEKTFWRTDLWLLEDKLPSFRTIKSCYWRHTFLDESGIIHGFIEISEAKAKHLTDKYSWFEVEHQECWFDVEKSSTLFEKFSSSGRFFELKELSVIGIDEVQGKVILNATSNIVCFDLRINKD